MKKNILTGIIYLLFVVGTCITLFIVYKDIDSSFSFAFVIGYVIYLFLMVFYFLIVIIINLSKLKWIGIRKRLYKYIAYFLILSVITYIVGVIFKPSQVDLYRIIFISLGTSFSLVFFDLIGFEKKKG